MLEDGSVIDDDDILAVQTPGTVLKIDQNDCGSKKVDNDVWQRLEEIKRRRLDATKCVAKKPASSASQVIT